jgi:hypothetical protein
MDEFCTRSLRAGLATAIALNWLLQFPPSVSLSAFLPRRTEEPILADHVLFLSQGKCAELVHEMADPRAGCAYHLRESLLIDFGDYSPGCAFLAEMGPQQ